MAEKRQVGTEEGQALAKELDVMFIEASAKAGINIKTLFKNLAQSLPGMDGNNGGKGDGGAGADGNDGSKGGQDSKFTIGGNRRPGDGNSEQASVKKNSCC